MDRFEVLLGKIRTEAGCGRGMLVLSILIGVALLGVAALSIVSGRVAKDESLLLEDVNDLRLHDVRGDAELEVLKARVEEVEFYHASVDTRLGVTEAEMAVLWEEHAASTPTPAPTPVVEEVSPAAPTVEEQVRTVVGSSLYLLRYDPLYEYLEYGGSVEFLRPGRVALSWSEKNSPGYKEFLLTPPQYRALKQNLEERNLLYGDFALEVTFEGEDLLVVRDPEMGDVLWDSYQTKGPRPLNALETWYLDYVMSKGWNLELEEVFDTPPKCTEWYGREKCEGVVGGWSPAEVAARGIAFSTHVNNPENGVWVEMWQSVDASYHWVDAESGETLPPVVTDGWLSLRPLPKSGWIELRVGEMFAPTARFNVYPGFLACVDQAAQICRAGSFDWLVWGYEWGAYQTSEVAVEDLMKELTP